MRWSNAVGVLLLVASCRAMHISSSAVDPCEGVVCRAGRECIRSGDEGQCLCVTSCPDHDKPVCGDDGRSYDNYCLLHQRACLTGERISVDYKGYCKKDIEEALREFGILSTEKPTTTTTTTTQRPAINKEQELSVCYGPQRNALRDSVISTWQRTVSKQPWYTDNMSYMDSLRGHFQVCDKDKDSLLRPDELLDCVEHVHFTPRPEQDLTVTKTLCIDAMVEETDTNKDWKLDYKEFSHLLDPLVTLVAKNCSLEGRDYTDGAEVRVTCNHCVCATGSWVCATHECDKKHSSTSTSKDDDFGYMDTKYDLKSADKKSSDDKKDDDYYYDDEYYDDDDYEDDEDYDDADDKQSMEKYKKEEAKKEFDSLSKDQQKKVQHLEDNIRRFQESSHNSHESNSINDNHVPSANGHSEMSNHISSDEFENNLIAEEDKIVEQYDNLLQQSRAIRDKLNTLRSSLSALERKKEDHDAHHTSLNTIDHSNVRPNTRTRKQQKYDAYLESLRASMNHHRGEAQINNDILEDRWKSKISKHKHHSLSNHL